jgi:aminoglycoside/choline kinase family phosphotransferase
VNEAEADRAAARQDLIRQAGFAGALVTALAGDASTRLYQRLTRPDGARAVLMDQPPLAESEPAGPHATPEERGRLGYNALARLAAGRVDAFVAIAAYLRARGLSAPEVLAFDAPRGLAVLEDLGDGLFARLIAEGAEPLPLYEAAVDVQVLLHAEAPPAKVSTPGASWSLCAYDALALSTYTDLFLDWWPRYAGLAPLPPEAREAFDRLCAPIRARAESGARVFAHRDFHAENLLWLPERQGLARVGLLDFQDAVKAHPAWDLLHLLQDARRDVDPALEALMLRRYLDRSGAADEESFLDDYAALAALNAARILGPIFARQVLSFGRTKYVAFMPRTWRYLERNLAHPGLEELRAWFDRWIPPEARA